MPDLNYLYAFQCPPSGLGLLAKPHHVAAALLTCRTLLHVHSIWTFPLMEAFPESECVSEGGWSSAELARCPDELASVSSVVCSLWSVSYPLAAAIAWYHKLAFYSGFPFSGGMIFIHERQLMLDLLEPCLCSYLPQVEQDQLVSCDQTALGSGFISLLCIRVSMPNISWM